MREKSKKDESSNLFATTFCNYGFKSALKGINFSIGYHCLLIMIKQITKNYKDIQKNISKK